MFGDGRFDGGGSVSLLLLLFQEPSQVMPDARLRRETTRGAMILMEQHVKRDAQPSVHLAGLCAGVSALMLAAGTVLKCREAS